MSFKFTFLGFESSSSKCDSVRAVKKEGKEKIKMVKRKLTSQQKKFKTAQAKCHAETTSPKEFGKCMSKKLTSGKKAKKRRSKK
jgi:hypothetical protein